MLVLRTSLEQILVCSPLGLGFLNCEQLVGEEVWFL